MKIGIGCDEAAYNLKLILKSYLEEKKIEVIDFGCKEGETVLYPDIAFTTANAVLRGECEQAILICGTGIGMSITANKVPGIRAAVCSEPYSAKMTAMHNDSNIIAMGARVVGSDMAKMIVDEFFETEYEGGRHEPRVQKISEVEAKYMKDRDNL